MDSGLEGRLRAHSAHFQSLVALIPPQYYAARESEDEAKEIKQSKRETRFWHNKKGEALSKSRKTTAHDSKQSEEGGTAAADSKKTELSVESVRSTSLSELRERLQKKISEAAQRKDLVPTESTETKQRKRRQRKVGDDGSSRKVKRLEEKRKRRERVKRGQEAKQKREAVTVAGASSGENSSQFSFSRFEFGNSSKTTAKKKKDYHTLISKAESKQKRLQELMGQDQERGEVAQEKEKWSKAVRMARGEKMKDDPKLLKKTVKRLEKKKMNSKVKWQERVKAEHQRQEARQKTRKQNIRERVDKIKAKKVRKRAKKRGIV